MAAPLVGRKVSISGLASRPELNGAKGVAIAFDDAKGRYTVRLDSGENCSLKPTNVAAADSGGYPLNAHCFVVLHQGSPDGAASIRS